MRAKSLRLIPLDFKYSASFMEEGFRPPKILEQVKILDSVGGQAIEAYPEFSMAKSATKKRPKEPEEVDRRPQQRTFIRAWRKKLGWTQGDLAEAIGVSTATISQIENLETGYKQWHLEAIAEALGCDPADLLTRGPDDPDGLWSLWQQAKTPEQRRHILRVLETLVT